MWQREAVCAKHQTCNRRRIERQRRPVGQLFTAELAEDKADEKTGSDPADRAEYADHRELPLLVFDIVKRQRVGQGQSWHVAHVVEQQQQNEQTGCSRRQRHREHDKSTEDMQGTEHFFGREVAIRNQSQEERRDDGSDGIYGVRPVCKVGHALRRHIVADRDVPRTPYKKLEEHHCAESRRGCVEHYSCLSELGFVIPWAWGWVELFENRCQRWVTDCCKFERI